MGMNADGDTHNEDTRSVYYDSDDLGSYYSDTNEEKCQRNQSSKILFDGEVLIHVFYLRMVFVNVKQVREAIAKYSIMKGLGIHLVKNDNIIIKARCKDGCPWVLLMSKDKIEDTWKVKT